MRYDSERGVYRDCKWCGGRGCLQCRIEAEKAYEAAFPGGAKPLAVYDMRTSEGIAAARKAIGLEALEHAFGPDGGGVDEIIRNTLQNETDDYEDDYDDDWDEDDDYEDDYEDDDWDEDDDDEDE